MDVRYISEPETEESERKAMEEAAEAERKALAKKEAAKEKGHNPKTFMDYIKLSSEEIADEIATASKKDGEIW